MPHLSNFVCDNPTCRDHVAMPANISTDAPEIYVCDEKVGMRKVLRFKYTSLTLDRYTFCGPCSTVARLVEGPR